MINLNLFQDKFFRDAVTRCVAEHQAYYGERLAAMYICGSVHRGEAIPGVSDLDTWVFINDDYLEVDREWEVQIEEKLQGEISGFKEMSRAISVKDAFGEETHPETSESTRLRSCAWFYRLRYDATLVWGKELTQGLQIQPPDATWAGASFRPVCNLVRHAAGLEERTNYDFKLPNTSFLRLRKLARLGVLSGAYLLAARGEFQSYKVKEVLPLLKQLFPQWADFLDETNALAIKLNVATAEQVDDYCTQLIKWMSEVEQLLSAA